jgi:hypothetical protein
MTKLKELNAAALVAVDAARAAARADNVAACVAAWDAYWAELEKTKEKQNDLL